MNRISTIILNIVIIGLLIGGVATYNYNNNRLTRYGIHVKLMERMMASPHAKEFKPLEWEEVAKGVQQEQPLSELDGKQVVLLGYGKPINADHVRDLGSVGTLGMDPCCDKPITYRNVSAMSLSGMPYHVYFWKQPPKAVEVELASGKRVDFVADQPAFYRGTLKLEGDAAAPNLRLEGAEKLDTSKGSVFGQGLPTAPAGAG